MLGDEAPEEWRDEVDQVFFRGRPFENEVTFLHRPSRTLVLCDLAFNFGPHALPATRLLMRLVGGYAEGKMVLEGVTSTPEGQTYQRITWHNNDDGTVRQVWEQSKDMRETWKTVFDGLYEKRP